MLSDDDMQQPQPQPGQPQPGQPQPRQPQPRQQNNQQNQDPLLENEYLLHNYQQHNQNVLPQQMRDPLLDNVDLNSASQPKKDVEVVSDRSIASMVAQQLWNLSSKSMYHRQPQSHVVYPSLPPSVVSSRSVALIEARHFRQEEIKCQECRALVPPENFKKHMDDHEVLKKTQMDLVELTQTNRMRNLWMGFLLVLACLLSFTICCSTVSFPISCDGYEKSCQFNFGEITIFKLFELTRGSPRYPDSAIDGEIYSQVRDRSVELFAELTKAKKDAEITELKQAKEKAEAELTAAAKLNAEIAGAKEKAEAEKEEAETKLAAATKLNAFQLKQAQEDGYLKGTSSNALELTNLALTIEESEAKRGQLEQQIISLMVEKKEREKEILKEHKILIERLRRGNTEPQERELQNEEEMF